MGQDRLPSLFESTTVGSNLDTFHYSEFWRSQATGGIGVSRHRPRKGWNFLLTVRDVARLADVSIATVSAVINGKSGVSDKLVQRVRRAMEALDYHPNHVARSLKVRQTYTIGMMIPDVTNPFFADVMQGVEGEARRNNYSVIFCNVDEDPELERRQLNMLFSRRVDGVLLARRTPTLRKIA